MGSVCCVYGRSPLALSQRQLARARRVCVSRGRYVMERAFMSTHVYSKPLVDEVATLLRSAAATSAGWYMLMMKMQAIHL